MAELLIGLYVGGIFGGATFAWFNDGHVGRPLALNLAILCIWPAVLVSATLYLICGVDQ